MEYDGTEFQGYQRQANGRTVQGKVEEALVKLNMDVPVTVYGAGRTDKGVHASGQVIAFDLSWRHGARRLANAINAHLPLDVAVKDVKSAHDDFCPRRSSAGNLTCACYWSLGDTWQVDCGACRSPWRNPD